MKKKKKKKTSKILQLHRKSQVIFFFILFDPWLWPEGSYKLCCALSILPFILLFIHPSFWQFSWNWSLVFSETLYCVRGLCGDVHDRP